MRNIFTSLSILLLAGVCGAQTQVDLAHQVKGLLPASSVTAPGFINGTNITITGTWPNLTFTASGGGGGIPYPSGSGVPVVAGGSAWGTTVAAPSGTIVGTSDTQTLTNKSLTAPTLTGVVDASAATDFKIPSVSSVPAVVGAFVYDSTHGQYAGYAGGSAWYFPWVALGGGTTGHCVTWVSAYNLGDAGAACGSGGGGLADPGANGIVKRTALNTTAVAVAADVTAALATDTVNNSAYGFHTGSGGDSTCPAPTSGQDWLCQKGGGINVSHNGGSYTPFVNGQAVQSIATGGTGASSVSFATLTDGATVTFNGGAALLANASLTLVHTTTTRTLNVSGLVNGGTYVIILAEDSTGVAGTFNLGTGCTWYVGGSAGFTSASTLTLTSTASAINIAAFIYDGANCYVNLR